MNQLASTAPASDSGNSRRRAGGIFARVLSFFDISPCRQSFRISPARSALRSAITAFSRIAAFGLRKPLEYLFAVFGTLALQGDPIRWVAVHRKHHAHADQRGRSRTAFVSASSGRTWIGSTGTTSRCLRTKRSMRYAPDLYADPFYRALQYLGAPLQLALAAALFFLGGWSWVVWGVFVRLVVSYHSTWLVNSAAHMLGYRTYRTDGSVDELLVGCGALVRRRLAQQPSCVSVLGSSRLALV